MKLEPFRETSDETSKAALERIRAAARQALREPPRRGWKGDLLLLLGAMWLLLAVVAGVLATSGELVAGSSRRIATSVMPLWWVGALAAFAALSPFRKLRPWGVLAAGLAAIAMVVGRGTPTAVSASPDWLCTVSHLGLGALPLGLGLRLLRRSALTDARAILLGLSIGTIGALMGELACSRGWSHVLVWHLGAWAGLGVAALIVARWLRPTSFAP